MTGDGLWFIVYIARPVFELRWAYIKFGLINPPSNGLIFRSGPLKKASLRKSIVRDGQNYPSRKIDFR